MTIITIKGDLQEVKGCSTCPFLTEHYRYDDIDRYYCRLIPNTPDVSVRSCIGAHPADIEPMEEIYRDCPIKSIVVKEES